MSDKLNSPGVKVLFPEPVQPPPKPKEEPALGKRIVPTGEYTLISITIIGNENVLENTTHEYRLSGEYSTPEGTTIVVEIHDDIIWEVITADITYNIIDGMLYVNVGYGDIPPKEIEIKATVNGLTDNHFILVSPIIEDIILSEIPDYRVECINWVTVNVPYTGNPSWHTFDLECINGDETEIAIVPINENTFTITILDQTKSYDFEFIVDIDSPTETFTEFAIHNLINCTVTGNIFFNIGDTNQLIATKVFSDGYEENFTTDPDYTWMLSDSNSAFIDNGDGNYTCVDGKEIDPYTATVSLLHIYECIYVGTTLYASALPINLIGVGDDQIIICEPIVYLIANITGPTDGHTFEWVQIDFNDEVILNSSNYYTSEYTHDGLPHTFRYYIDRGQPNEQFMDVDIITLSTISIAGDTIANEGNTYNYALNIVLTDGNSLAMIEGDVIWSIISMPSPVNATIDMYTGQLQIIEGGIPFDTLTIQATYKSGCRVETYNINAVGNPITLINNGDNIQQVLCTAFIYMEAIVSGDVSGHTFEWVQVSGTFTTLEYVTPLKTFYTNDGTSKIFRLYVDRGTAVEQYSTFIINTKPTSYISTPADTSTAYALYEPYGHPSYSIIDYYDDPTSSGKATYDYEHPVLVWTSPTFNKPVKSYMVQELTGSGWVTTAVYDNNIQYHFVDIGKTYRLQTTYTISDKYITAPDFTYNGNGISVVADRNRPEAIDIVNITTGSASSYVINISFITRTILSLTGSDTIEYSTTVSDAYVVNASFISRTKNELSGTSTTNAILESSSSYTSNVSVYLVGGIIIGG